MTRRLSWGAGLLSLDLEWAETVAPRWSAVELDGTRVALGGGLPVAEVLTVEHGHEPASARLVHGWIGPRLRHAGHATSIDADGTARLRLDLAGAGLRVTQHLAVPVAAAVVRAEVEVVNTGRASVVLRTVPSWSARIGGHLADWRLFTAHSDWLAENRWRTILRLRRGEAKIGGAQLVELPTTAQPGQRQARIGAGRHDQMQLIRKVLEQEGHRFVDRGADLPRDERPGGAARRRHRPFGRRAAARRRRAAVDGQVHAHRA